MTSSNVRASFSNYYDFARILQLVNNVSWVILNEELPAFSGTSNENRLINETCLQTL